MAAQIDILDQLKAWIRIGVLPFGAQVLRMEGRCETPLSSWKKTQAFRRLAFFLKPATSALARTSLSPGRALWLAWPVVAATIAWRQGSSTHGRGDNARRSIVPSPSRHAAASIDRCRSRAPVHLAATLSLPAGVACHRSEERRVGKEGRSRWSRDQSKKKTCTTVDGKL